MTRVGEFGLALSPRATGSRPTVARLGLALAAALFCCAGGCGPIQSGLAISETEAALKQADAADAARLAPYHRERAAEFLHHAKLKRGYSEFEAAMEFASLARKSADEATALAKQRSGAKPAAQSPVRR